jgi:tripartite-type tricarboxylate transporter receptor subunit TctC
MAPSGTPKDIVARLAAVLIGIVQRQDIREKLLHAGFRATGEGPQAFRDRILREVPKWRDVIAKAHIKAE